MSRPFENLKKELKKEILQLAFPIGQSYVTQTNTNPATILGFGTWERVKGKVLVGLDEDDTDFNTIGKIGGEKTHTLTVDEMPSHNHYNFAGSGGPINFPAYSSKDNGIITVAENGYGSATSTSGGNQPHSNLQPFQVIGYMWIRTA